MSTDGFVAEVAEAVANRMTATGLRGKDLRERDHLDPFTKDECERRTGVRPASRTLRTLEFPRIGPVDVVLNAPKALIELKWAYYSPGKVFESLWDAIKLALLGATLSYGDLYVATGASLKEWSTSESADLFLPGHIDPLQLWARPLIPPRGPNYGKTVGEDLVIGARGNWPHRVHRSLAIRSVGAWPVANNFELRVIGVIGEGPLIAWPGLEQPPPNCAEPETLEDVQLPARVTQAWIERTAPRLAVRAIAPFLGALRHRGWSEDELTERVLPHLPAS